MSQIICVHLGLSGKRTEDESKAVNAGSPAITLSVLKVHPSISKKKLNG